jgi:hypothetical protein
MNNPNIPLTSLRPFFNAKSQRRQDAKREEALCASASLRLCVENPAIIRGEIFAKLREDFTTDFTDETHGALSIPYP